MGSSTGGGDSSDSSSSSSSNSSSNSNSNTDHEVDYLSTVIGFSFGPLVLVYGNSLQAIVIVFNALYTAGLQRLTNTIQDLDCIEELTTENAVNFYTILFAAVTIAGFGLRKGSMSTILKVGVISQVMQNSVVAFIATMELPGYYDKAVN